MRKLKLLIAACLVTVAASASKTVYLAPGSWDVSDATERYALYMYNDAAGTNAWTSFTEGTDGTWSAVFEESYPNMILCRMNGASTENNWDNKWAQTDNLAAPTADGLLYTITGNDGETPANNTYFITPYALSKGGKFYLKSVEAAKFWGAGNSWGTQASLLEHPEYVTLALQNDGRYTIESQVSNGGTNYYFNGDFMDNSNAHWLTFTKKENGSYTIADDGPSYYGYDGNSTVLGKNIDGSSDNALWNIYSEADMRTALEAATALEPVDATWLILDQGFGRNNRNSGAWSTWSQTSDNKTNLNISGGNNTNNCAESYHAKFYVKQTLTGLPKGAYRMTAQGFYRQDGSDNDNLPYFYLGTTENKITLPLKNGSENSMSTASESFTAGSYTIDPLWVYVAEGGELELGVRNDENYSLWCIFDNFVLTYYGDCTISEAQNAAYIVDYNNALAAAQAFAKRPMAATAKATLEGVIDANDDLDTTTATAEQLSAATTALNDAVSAAQPSIDLYASIKSLETQLKTQYDDFSVDTKYNAGSYTALSEVYSDYYAFAVTKLGTEANTDYTKAIVNPSFEFGNTIGWTYEPSNDHGAKTYAMSGKDGNYLFNIWSAGHPITQTITGLPKGLYELKAVVANSSDGDPAKVYLLANDVHEGITCDTNGDTGVEGSVKVAVSDGNLTIGAVGSNNDADRSYIAAGVWWYKVDNFRLTYLGNVVSDEDAAALLATVPEGKMNADVKTALNSAKTAFEASKTTDNYSALQTAIENANASITAYTAAKTAIDAAKDVQENTNVVTAAAATTFAEAIAAIETPYNEGTLTTDVANAAGSTLGVVVSGWHANANGAAGKYMESAWDNAENFGDYYINTWSTEGSSDGSNFVVPFFEYWTGSGSLGAKTMTATQENLKPNGIYTVSVWARVSGNNKVANSITMQVGEGTATDLTAGTQIGSTGRYLDTFTATGQADADGKLTIKINVAANSNISWFSFKNVKYAEVESASSDDYAALADAISAAEGKTLGFEAGEYAPYNNVAAIEALAAAKAIDANVVNAKADVEAATTALTAATWTANEAEVSAINLLATYDASNVDGSNRVYAPGWGKNGGSDAYNTRLVKGTDGNAGMAAVDNELALFTKFGTTYGEEDGYTMPLKANTVYKLSFKFGAWGENKEIVSRLAIADANGNAIAITPASFTRANNSGLANAETNAWFDYVGFFETAEAGNYVLTLTKDNNGEQRQIVMGNIDLKKAPVYAVVGSDKAEENAVIFSGKWDEATQTDIMTFENGVFTKTYADQVLDAQTIAFKVIEKASVEATTADAWHGNSEGNNVEMVLSEANTYDITITFDGLNVSYSFVPATETFTVGTAGWATAVTHYAVDFTGVEGLKAYTATITDGTVTLAEAGAVPAGTALVLKGETKAVPTVESAEAVTNDLKGSNEYDYVINDDMDDQYTFYGLTVKDGTAKFAKLNKGTIQPGKAYLQIEKTAGDARELSVVFAGEATGINAVTAESAAEGIYNMNGQRVTAPAKGLYIVNGKKVILK